MHSVDLWFQILINAWAAKFLLHPISKEYIMNSEIRETSYGPEDAVPDSSGSKGPQTANVQRDDLSNVLEEFYEELHSSPHTKTLLHNAKKRRTARFFWRSVLWFGFTALYVSALYGFTNLSSGDKEMSDWSLLFFAYLPAVIALFMLGSLFVFNQDRFYKWEQDRIKAENIKNPKGSVEGIIGLIRGYLKSKRRSWTAVLVVVLAAVYSLSIVIFSFKYAVADGLTMPNYHLLIGLALTVLFGALVFRSGQATSSRYLPAICIGIIIMNAYYTEHDFPREQFLFHKRDKVKEILFAIFKENSRWF